MQEIIIGLREETRARTATRQIVKGKTLKRWMQPMVYGWYRKGEYLYIGQSTRGMNRIYGHDVIRWERIQDDDEIHIWTPIESVTITQLEQQLLMLHRPVRNGLTTYSSKV